MSTSSSEEGSRSAGHYATSSGRTSTESILSCFLSGTSGVQTDITPPTSPAPSEGKMRTPRDTLDASRRLEQICARVFQGDAGVPPTGTPEEVHLCAPPQVVANDNEAGYDADGDGDGDGEGSRNEFGRARVSADATAKTRPVCRRPAFLRIDTRQHRRIVSMLAIRHPTSPALVDGDGDGGGDAATPHRPHAKLSSIRLLKPNIHSGGKNADTSESYELRQRPRAELVGLGIGFPENHPLHSRAFTLPVPTSASPTFDPEQQEEGSGVERWKESERTQKQEQTRRSDCRPSAMPTRSTTKPVQAGVYAPYPVRLALRPTFLAMAPSPTEDMPARRSGRSIAGTFRCDDARDRLGIERERSRTWAREGRIELNRA